MDDQTCSICLDPLLGGPSLTTLPCNHAFHVQCLAPWLAQARTCPNCRAHVLDWPTDMLLRVALCDKFFSAARRACPYKLAQLMPECNGSTYLAAVECSKQALQMSNPQAMTKELAFMLVYLHISGDPRAAMAAKSPRIDDAIDIAQGLVRWAQHGCLQSGSLSLVPRIRRCRRWCFAR